MALLPTNLTNEISLMRIEFFEAFLVRYIPQSVRDHLRYQFTRLEYSAMIISKYESQFHQLS